MGGGFTESKNGVTFCIYFVETVLSLRYFTYYANLVAKRYNLSLTEHLVLNMCSIYFSLFICLLLHSYLNKNYCKFVLNFFFFYLQTKRKA